jgi:hypothetical protein
MDVFAFDFDAPDLAAERVFFWPTRFFFGLFVPKIEPSREPSSDIDLASIASRRSSVAENETGQSPLGSDGSVHAL